MTWIIHPGRPRAVGKMLNDGTEMPVAVFARETDAIEAVGAVNIAAATAKLLASLEAMTDFAKAHIGAMDDDDLAAYEAARATIANAKGIKS